MRRVAQARVAAEASVQGVAVYHPGRDGDPIPHGALYEAIRHNRLLAYLQPIVDVATGELVAVEWLARSEEHTSELQSLMRSSYAVVCLRKKASRFSTYHRPS